MGLVYEDVHKGRDGRIRELSICRNKGNIFYLSYSNVLPYYYSQPHFTLEAICQINLLQIYYNLK